MKKFLTKIIRLFFLFSSGILAFTLFVHIVVKYQSNFRLPKGTKFLILGHSYPECAYNDGVIDKTKNLAKSSEAYFYTYQKLIEVLPENKIEAVFLEFSNNQIEKRMDSWTWGFDNMNKHLPQHLPFLSYDDMMFLFNKNSMDFIKVISNSSLLNFTRIVNLDNSISMRYGGFRKLTHVYKPKKAPIKGQKFSEEISYDNLNYLKKMIEFCKANNVKIYLIRSPRHKDYPSFNEVAFKSIKNNYFKNVEFLDFSGFPIHDNEFADISHLNNEGAMVFSKWFNMLLNNSLLKVNDKQGLISKELEKL